jgi:hypothetical protein
MGVRSVSVSLLIAGWALSASAAMDITDCDVTVPAGEKAVLQNDIVCEAYCDTDPTIDCSGSDDELCGPTGHCIEETITIGPGSKLDLNGHQIRPAYRYHGVVCGAEGDVGSCTIIGPGGVAGQKGTGVISATLDVKMRSVWIDNTDVAVRCGGFLDLRDVRVGGREDWIFAAEGIRARDVDVGPAGMETLGNMVLNGIESGINGGPLIAAGKVKGKDLNVVGRSTISGRSVFLRNLTSTPEAEPPIDDIVTIEAVEKLRLVDSNAGTIESGKKPKLVNSTCLQSVVAGSSATWGVCTND